MLVLSRKLSATPNATQLYSLPEEHPSVAVYINSFSRCLYQDMARFICHIKENFKMNRNIYFLRKMLSPHYAFLFSTLLSLMMGCWDCIIYIHRFKHLDTSTWALRDKNLHLHKSSLLVNSIYSKKTTRGNYISKNFPMETQPFIVVPIPKSFPFYCPSFPKKALTLLDGTMFNVFVF